jgi:hypothetical protein
MKRRVERPAELADRDRVDAFARLANALRSSTTAVGRFNDDFDLVAANLLEKLWLALPGLLVGAATAGIAFGLWLGGGSPWAWTPLTLCAMASLYRATQHLHREEP